MLRRAAALSAPFSPPRRAPPRRCRALRPAQDADGEKDVVVDRDALEPHAAAERRRPGEEVVGAGAVVRLAEGRTWKRRLSVTVGLLETRMVSEEYMQTGMYY